ncbi:DUF4258 domain-containing protein [Cytobacillus praedii]|uniref:DUF4258 domain-containing protein n=1 Tax=Cytobacillus praedii TaxID=1742358 RepID=UPI002E24D385|nr:DUF4258 domain-containing protein [Cytobacillus praedii]
MKERERGRLRNDHMKAYWEKEMEAIREVVLSGENILSSHIINQMNKRNISVQEVAATLLNGKIVEGYDIGDYSGYRNPNIFRTVVCELRENYYVIVGLALSYSGSTIKIENFNSVYSRNNLQKRFNA